MKSFNLNIADYALRFESADPETILFTAKKYEGFLCADTKPGITIRVHSGTFTPGDDAVRMFHAPDDKGEFWSVCKNNEDIIIEAVLSRGTKIRKAWLVLNTGKDYWDLYITGTDKKKDPLEYPLDGLLLYYLTVRSGDIFIHGSGVSLNNRGYVFTAVSGKGKTTIARLFQEAGGRVIHDDRLIIRWQDGGFVMHNTPVYDNESPRRSAVDRIFIIDHAGSNVIRRAENSEAVSLVMANCIQHLWDASIIESLTGALIRLTTEKDVSRLYFKPDKSIISHILENEK